MDANLFRLPTFPNYYASNQAAAPYTGRRSAATAPTPNARFPGWTAPSTDGRLVTDYRSRCEQNVPCKAQEKTRMWIQHNTDDIIRVSRERLARTTGMVYGIDMTTQLGPATYVHCTRAGCSYTPGVEGGVGVERADPVPFLFGTYEPNSRERQGPSVQQTTLYEEGGRNSRRGL